MGPDASLAQALAKNLGVPDLAHVASRHVRDATAALSRPGVVQARGLVACLGDQLDRPDRAFAVAVRGADDVAGELDRPEVADVYGSRHLTAALAAMTLGRTDTATDHMSEAADVAGRPGIGTGFGNL